MEEQRKQFNDVIIGCQGSGKTSLLLNIMAAYNETNPWKRILIGLPDDSEEKFYLFDEIQTHQLRGFRGIKKIFIDSPKPFFEALYSTFLEREATAQEVKCKFNGLFIMDDAGTFLNRRDEKLLKFFKRRRQTNIDILTTFHGLRNDVPPSFYTFVTRVVLFRTLDAPEDTIDLLPTNKRDEFLQVYERVQAESEKNPYYHEEIILNKII